MGVSFADIIGRAKVPVRSVTICLDLTRQAEHDQLREQLEAANRVQSRMGQQSEAQELAAKIQALENEMQESLATFEFHGVSKAVMDDLIRSYPPKKGSGQQWDVEDGGPEFLAACSHNPVMTVGETKQLRATLNVGTWTLLTDTAWLATNGPSNLPFSVRASEVMSASASK